VRPGLLPGLLAAAPLGRAGQLARLRAPAAPGAAAKLGLALLAGVAAHALAPQGVALAAGWTALTLTALVLLVPRADEQGWRLALLLTALPALGAVLFLGDGTWLPEVETDRWGGMFLSLVIALVGIATSLPVGILLALGRRSSLPVIRTLSICYIELIRGVPLISVLFMASVMLPLTLPDGMHVDKLLRALVGVSLFYAAYMAEVVRGGLQGIGRGHYVAAQSLGLSYPKAMILVIMPQALRLVIPGITNTFLGLMKDTTLVAVINLMDLLGVIKSALADSQWLGFTKEAYLFAALAFWVLCFGLSRFALHLERRLRYEKH
jgi:general L-amino acid transport system permease protein